MKKFSIILSIIGVFLYRCQNSEQVTESDSLFSKEAAKAFAAGISFDFDDYEIEVTEGDSAALEVAILANYDAVETAVTDSNGKIAVIYDIITESGFVRFQNFQTYQPVGSVNDFKWEQWQFPQGQEFVNTCYSRNVI